MKESPIFKLELQTIRHEHYKRRGLIPTPGSRTLCFIKKKL
uniref:Uncharacterized protein n=1 Tax=Picea sitchensis TaxID=3332 RepID=D5A9E5_PICSI|nr:unknown [Picea sitchensis]